MDAMMGQISLFAFSFAPQGWMPCQGQILSIQQNEALFALIGTTYGGDGINTFALPNLKAPGDENSGMHYCICVQGIYPTRS